MTTGLGDSCDHIRVPTPLEPRLLNDQPVFQDAQSDLLGRGPVIAQLADLVRRSHSAAPLTVAIYGEWGAGKSSILRQMASQLSMNPNVETVWFNAWTGGSSDILEDLIKAVLDRLDPRTLRRLARRLDSATGAAAWSKIVARGLAGVFGLHHLVDAVWEKLSVDAATRGKAREQLYEAFHSWTSGQQDPATDRLIVVFIDDLDRCQQEVVQSVCAAMKAYLSLPGLVFVIGCDRVTIEGAVAPDGHNYLEKMIQASYTIPAPTDEQVLALITGYAEASGTSSLFGSTADAIAEHAGRNPRRIKRLINSFTIEYQIDAEWQDLSASALVRVILLQEFYPAFLTLLARQDIPDPFDDIADYVAVREQVESGVVSETQQERVERCLRRNGVDPDADSEPSQTTLDRIEGRLPEDYVRLARDAAFVRLVAELAEDPAGAQLRSKLRRRQAAAPVAEASPELGRSQAFGDFLVGRSKPLDITVVWLSSHRNHNTQFLESLTARGARIIRANQVEEVLRLLAGSTVANLDAIVTNLRRDGDTDGGFDDLDRIRTGGYTGPALIFTGYVSRDRRERARECDADITASVVEADDWLKALRGRSASTTPHPTQPHEDGP